MPPTTAERLGRQAGEAVYGLLKFAVVVLVALAVIRGLWEWTVPDLFPGAVGQGLVARTVSWGTALLIALGVTMFAAALRFLGLGPGRAEAFAQAMDAKLDAVAAHLGLDPKAVLAARLMALVRGGDKIGAIRVYRGYAGVGLAEAKAYIEGLERTAEHGSAPDRDGTG
jgi:hypothetical protein